MSPKVIPPRSRKNEAAVPRIQGRTNAIRNARVMPPYCVDLTLPPSVADDIHVPAHVSGGDLSTGGPATSEPSAQH